MGSKGQFEHVFAFLMLMLIAVVVLLLGYKFIGLILKDQCSVESVDFKITLEKTLKDYSSYGTLQRPAFTAPCKAQSICFVDADKYVDNDNNGIYDQNNFEYLANRIIQSEINAPSTPPSNVFLIHENGQTEPLQLFSEKIDVEGDVLCVNATANQFRLTMRGNGRTVTLSAS